MSQYTDDIRYHMEKVLNTMEFKENGMDISAGAAHGDNYTGVIAKVVIKGEDKTGKNITLTFIVKTAPTNEAFRAFSQVRSVFGREIFIYNKVFPIFTKLQEERGTLKRFKSFATCYGTSDEECKEALVMEDLKELGYSLCDRREPLDYNHVVLVLREYGKLHALSFALRDQKPDLFKELSENTEDTYFENFNFSEASKNSFRAATNNALFSLDPVYDQVAYKKFLDFKKTMFEEVENLVKSKTAGKYAVITHGDCWMNNILYKYEDSSNPKLPTDLKLIDWQLSRLASPVLDLAYFIFTCTDSTLREQHYDDMIEEYYNSLKTFLVELGSDPEEMFPFKVLKEHLKKFSRYGMHMAIIVLHLMTSEVEEIPDFQNLDNMEDVAQKLTFGSKNEEKYKNKMRSLILDFIKFDYEF